MLADSTAGAADTVPTFASAMAPDVSVLEEDTAASNEEEDDEEEEDGSSLACSA